MRRLPLRQILCALPLVAVAVWVSQHWSLIETGGREVLAADRFWLLMAVVTTLLGWVAVSFARQGTVLERLPAKRLVVTQFAAGAANHLLPSGIGAGAVNIRFMARCGVPPARYSAALALYFLAEGVSRVALLLLLLLAFPEALRLQTLLPEQIGLPLVATAGVALLAVLVAVVLAVGRLRRLVGTFLRTALTDVRSLHARPGRVLALWGGSLAFPLLQAAGLVAVALSLELPVPVAHIVLAYMAASVVAAAVPSPGGIGSVDASLVVALVAIGASVGAATSTVLAYRLITIWLPLLPGALVLGALVRRKVI
ncbi:lysylphosphatidylglycerol synthase transmembrane domain-containing protein [Streptomyces litchfieldiae]|uniref:Lysylphosphatidylglycerol synthase transmembrane domain-containing protein n=1 Tax=Streptomyces litchfieldiae TaxID=3075543 RepID=A0ABU2MR42_9ACTN|nr:lysylphosphatidylglycerol synthase transmembrane domain-containing protein [Streptomyces sp. DSM 44938]MDT0343074.1 lysylphosphatidylglycerol synthase transmembrane domain-containing protein [Streptomyces sp. DSM 44938]